MKKSLGEKKYQELILGSKLPKKLIKKEEEKTPQIPKEDLSQILDSRFILLLSVKLHILIKFFLNIDNFKP